MASWRTLNLKVTGEQKIHCASCEHAIQRALKTLPGIRSAQADHRTQRIDVNLDSDQTTFEQLEAKLALMGYQVTQG